MPAFIRHPVCILVVLLTLNSCAGNQFSEPPPLPPPPPGTLDWDYDVPYVPSPDAVVDEMLKVADVSEDDFVVDLGSGDGRIVITAAQQRGARGIGIELDSRLIMESRANAEKAGVGDRVEFLQQDLFETDLSEATVVTLYLLPSVNLELRPKLLRELKPGTRVVSHNYDMGDWKPDKVIELTGLHSHNDIHTVYFWVVPDR